jgi:hypothetical protein
VRAAPGAIAVVTRDLFHHGEAEKFALIRFNIKSRRTLPEAFASRCDLFRPQLWFVTTTAVDGSRLFPQSDSRTGRLLGDHAHLPRVARNLTRMTHLPSTVRRQHKPVLA